MVDNEWGDNYLIKLEIMKSLIFINFVRTVLQLIVPDRCRVCGEFISQAERPGICRICLNKMQILDRQTCHCCGRPIAGAFLEEQICGSCLKVPPPWKRCFSLVQYDSPVSDLLHNLKYRADTSVMPALQSIVSEALSTTMHQELKNVDLVLPVPLHPSRLKERGLNQSAYIAKAIFKPGLVDCSSLKRGKLTIPQTGLTGIERRRNLRGAFVVHDKAPLRGKTICLVDDVFTTGTTVMECCHALSKGGATEIYVVTLARVIVNR